jgi:hypothetical protein
VPKSSILAESQVTPWPRDTITIGVVQPDDMPAHVAITWPLQPSVIDPEHFRDTAAMIVRLFSEAHVTLAAIKARRLR